METTVLYSMYCTVSLVAFGCFAPVLSFKVSYTFVLQVSNVPFGRFVTTVKSKKSMVLYYSFNLY